MKNFWKNLSTPFIALAPMDGVTDFVFRQIIAEIGRPDVFFTEFVNCDGLNSEGRKIAASHLQFGKNEKPIVAQIWGVNPDNFYKTAKYVKKLGFDGIDINMGCPQKTVIKNGACSALIKNLSLAKKVIEAARKGAGGLPVSVKTRIGFEKEEVDRWIVFLLRQNLSALTVHLRTVREMSKVPAHWKLMPKIIELRDRLSPDTIVIGNGGIKSLAEIDDKHRQYGCEGLMVGEAIFTNPWLFNKAVNYNNVSVKDKLNLFIKHIKLFEKTWGMNKNPAILKKFCKTYVNNFPQASSLREKLMETKTCEDLIKIIVSRKQ